MAKAPFQSYAADEAGNVLAWPFTVTVRREAAGAPIARIYDANDTPLANPMTVSALNGWAEGFFRFHVAGGAYRIDVTKGAYAAEPLRYVQLGTYGGADQGSLLEEGYLHEFEAETVAPPSDGFFRFDNADLSLATTMWVSKTTRGGYDVAARLLELDPGTNSVKNTLHVRGAEVTGASWLVDAADDGGGADDYVTIDLSAHAGDTAFETEVYSLQREMAGQDGEDSAESVNGQTHAASEKATLHDDDEEPVIDSEAAFGLKKRKWSQKWAQILSKLGALIGTTKATVIDADGFFIADSAASNAPKVTLFSALKTTLALTFTTITGLGLSKSYTSAEQTITSSGTLSLEHGMGAAPKVVQLQVVCKTAENGYSVNEVLIPFALYDDGASSRGAAITLDATHITVGYGADSNVFNALHKSTRARVSLTNGNWRLIVRAWS